MTNPDLQALAARLAGVHDLGCARRLAEGHPCGCNCAWTEREAAILAALQGVRDEQEGTFLVRVHPSNSCHTCRTPLVWTAVWQGWDCVVCIQRDRDQRDDAAEAALQAREAEIARLTLDHTEAVRNARVWMDAAAGREAEIARLREDRNSSCACQQDGGELISECQEHQEIREERDKLTAALAAALARIAALEAADLTASKTRIEFVADPSAEK